MQTVIRRLEICAELSCNHLGSFDRAMAIAQAAAIAGADLFKVQVWKSGTMCLDRSYVLDSGPWKGRRLFDLYEEAYTPWGWLPRLFDRCRELGMEPFGAAFDKESVDYLCTLGVKRLKVSSFELTDLPLIRHMASKGLPIILSTGMATEDEIIAAWNAAGWSDDVTLLACTSAYPAQLSDANLIRICDTHQTPVNFGLSDHTLGITAAVVAAARGATYIEKHLALSRADGGPDAGFSMEPQEFARMVLECRRVVETLGERRWGVGPHESTALRRSLYVAEDLRAGDRITADNVRTARPALGLPPAMLPDLIGRTVKTDVATGTPLKEDFIA